MCLVKIDKNSFYRKLKVPASGAVVLAPRFKDLAITGGTTIDLEAGMNPSKLVVSGSVPAAPSYGQGKLVGGYFRTFVSGISLSGTNSLPITEMYKIQEGIGPSQGSYEFAKRDATGSVRGNKLYVMSSYMDGSSAWLEENFDGSDKSLGEFTLLGDQGTSTLSLADAYIPTAKLAASLLFQGGDAFMGMGSDNIKMNLELYFSDPHNDQRIYVKPVKRNKVKGLWTTSNDRRSGKQTWSIYAPFWKWETIKGHLKFASAIPATDNIDSAKDATEGNTIFNNIAVQGNFGNVFTAGEEAPLLESVAELSTEKKVSGGQSCRLYHLWQYNPDMAIAKKIEATLGAKKINPQVTRASVYNIPEPPPALDMGAFNYSFVSGTQTVSSQIPAIGGLDNAGGTNSYPGLLEGGHLTDKRLTFPEINITMNITKLFAAPQITTFDPENYAIWGGQTVSGCHTYGYASSSLPYDSTGDGAHSLWYWAQKGTRDIDGLETTTMFQNAKGGLNTLLRSVCVTFSNYKPDPYPTLDEFLAASLDSAYWTAGFGGVFDQSNYKADTNWSYDETKLKLACGVLFQNFRGTSEYNLAASGNVVSDQDINPNSIYAMALPMSRYNEHASGDTGLYASGGFAKFDAAGRTWSGSCTLSGGAMTLVHDARIGLMDLTEADGSGDGGGKLKAYNDDGTSGKPWGDSGSREEPLWVEIEKDSWFNLKFVFDSQARFAQSKPYPEGTGSTEASNTTTSRTDVSGGMYSYSVGTGATDGSATEVIDGIADYGLADPSVQFGVPIRCYISGAKGNAGLEVTGTRDDVDDYTNVPYLNLPIPFRGSTVVKGNAYPSYVGSSTNWLRCNNNYMRGNDASSPSTQIQEGTYSPIGDQFPFKYMTIWVQNYRHTDYQDKSTQGADVDYSCWRGNYYNGSIIASADHDADGKWRAADSKLYPSGLSAEAEVFIDNITFKNWNNEHVNHSMDAGNLTRFIKFENNKVMSPATTFFNTGSIYDDDASSDSSSVSDYETAVGGANTMTSMMKGFNASGNWRALNPGQFLCIGVDDPQDLPLTFVSGALGNGDAVDTGYGGEANIQSGYFLFNNFKMTGDFSALDRLVPDVAFVSTAPAGMPDDNDQATVAQMKGVVPYDTSIAKNLGANVAGRNFALFNPVIAGIGTGNTEGYGSQDIPTDTYLRTKQAQSLLSGLSYPDQLQFNDKDGNTEYGWVIDNHGELYAKNTDDYPQRYSNCAAWAGSNYRWDTGTGLISGNWIDNDSGSTDPTEGQAEMYSGFNWLAVTGGTTQAVDYALGSGGAVNMGTGSTATWLSTDGFTQKGFVKIDIDQTSNTGSTTIGTLSKAWNKWSRFAPRENILCAAKITSVPLSNTIMEAAAGGTIEGPATIEVDDTSIFNINGDDRYVIFQVNKSENSWNMLPNSDNFTPSFGGAVTVTNTGNCSGALGYHSMVKLSNIDTPVQGNNVTLVVTDDDSGTLRTRPDGVFRADDGVTKLCSESNLHSLWISPLKYWLNLGFFEDPNGTATDMSRSYESIATINPVTQTVDPDPSLNEAPGDGSDDAQGNETTNTISGSTYNEFLYHYDTGSKSSKGESSLMVNPWILEVANKDQTSLDLQDYGYGDYESDKNDGGQAGIKSVWRNRLNYMDIGGVVTADKRSVNSPDEPIVLTLGLNDLETSKKATLYSDEYTGSSDPDFSFIWEAGQLGADVYNPTFIWTYHDKLPKIKNFTVGPTFNALEKDVNLYALTNENLNSLNFTWDEESEGDIWYRMLMIDNEPIQNKYHKAILWIPLNESGNAVTVTTAPTRTWYSDSTSSEYTNNASGNFVTDTNTGSKVLATIEGLSGYAAQTMSGSATQISADFTAQMGVLSIAYANPAGANQTPGFNELSEYTFVLHTIPDSGAVDSVIFSHGNTTTGFVLEISGGKIKVTQSGTALVGTSNVPTDGETPISVIVTYKNGSSTGEEGPDFQLYVNGKREDYAVTATNATTEEEIMIGSDTSQANIYAGKIEEIILYEKRYEIPQTEEGYVYSTLPLADTDGSDIGITYNAKLFLYDYHNIRGKESDEVCESSPVSWRTTI